MAPTATEKSRAGLDVVRARLLTSLHVGRLDPGDRVPSVRRLADLTGLNRKTVHRAFTTLAREGLLEVRPGAGTFVRARSGTPATDTPTEALVATVRRIRAAATALGLDPRVFSAFVSAAVADGLVGERVAIVECNREQTEIIARDLVREIGVVPLRIPLKRLHRRGVFAGVRSVVTTDCHREEVASRAAPLGLGIHAVSLDPRFPRALLDRARTAPVVLVTGDPGFGPVLIRLLRQLGAGRSELERLEIVDWARAPERFEDRSRSAFVWVSPVAPDTVKERIPREFRPMGVDWHVPLKAVERVRAGLALDLACAAVPVAAGAESA